MNPRSRLAWLLPLSTLVAFNALACSSDSSGEVAANPDSGAGQEGGAGAGSDAGLKDADAAHLDAPGIEADAPHVDAAPPVGDLSPLIRIDHFGWRTADNKVAVVLNATAGLAVELRRAVDSSTAGSFTAGSVQVDEDSGDSYAPVDFSSVTEPGEFYLLIPSLGARSYPFRIADDVYNIVGAASVKAYYYQRCNHDKALPYASDVLGGFPGIGGQWVDGACHMTDSSAKAGPGSDDHGALDVHGGWHDAGDYQKTLWGRGVPEMLFAMEINPGAWTDGQLNTPESANGIPDLLDEVAWELDFYVRMQRPDGHFMSSTKGHAATVTSPPSASDEERVYFDCTSPNGGEWSGGGVTLGAATANGTMSVAHAAIVYRAIGQNALADKYQQAALAGWGWLNGYTAANEGERRGKAAAAAAVYRMDPTQASAKALVEAFDWSGWDGMLPYSATPSESVIAAGAWHVLANAAASTTLKDTIKTAVGQALVDTAFTQQGAYGGMFGDSSNGWDYSWGSNRSQSQYGANLMMAVHFGALGSHSQQDVVVLAEKHFHYMTGLNPLNMVYLTNMAAYGGEHSSFQIYHGWFSYTAGDGDHGNAQYNGKPASVVEPLYPYYPDDSQTSTFGPAPGIIPGGPNYYYSATYTIPNKNYPAYAYRDFSVGCGWDGSQCTAASWEITEPMQAYQGPFVLLASFMMHAN
ncbi:MAG: glycoside hydrolase family 9 protein [Deltaproteobacteria bacterium]|nr:glycoside hydrolase family 9 protein [Deltaproteobacteria bacterium]